MDRDEADIPAEKRRDDVQEPFPIQGARGRVALGRVLLQRPHAHDLEITGHVGSKQAQVYLASPFTVAASAVTGRITDPRDFLI